jgi:4-hydroxyphenylpyruvate dioxygenase
MDQPFQQAIGPGELEIPAVRGLGGSLVYFIDSESELGKVWTIEFDPPANAAGPGHCGLTGVDHISQSMRYSEMLSLVLFYVSLLDVTKTPAEDVVDPRGLVKSQVVQSEDGALRIALNASEAQGTLSARFLSESFGSGVQHIAFATDDILATVAKLTANGIKLLPIPENYYDDLEAKTDLPPERIDALKAANILYDRDGDGEYLQAYTQTLEERFFFEIVERRAYRGFGAANAPIRLAAQTQIARRPGIPRH